MKVGPNPYRDKRDRSTLWIVVGVLVFVLVAGAVAVWTLLAALH